MIQVMSESVVCEFWGISKEELEVVIDRGFLRVNMFGQILWNVKYVGWREILRNQGKRICDLEKWSHRAGMRKLKGIGSWDIYKYSNGAIAEGRGDNFYYVYGVSGLLEKVFDRWGELENWCKTHDSVKVSRRGLKLAQTRKGGAVESKALETRLIRERAKAWMLEQEMKLSSIFKGKGEELVTGGDVRCYPMEVTQLLEVVMPHLEEMGVDGMKLVQKLCGFLNRRDVGYELTEQLYRTVTANETGKVKDAPGKELVAGRFTNGRHKRVGVKRAGAGTELYVSAGSGLSDKVKKVGGRKNGRVGVTGEVEADIGDLGVGEGDAVDGLEVGSDGVNV